jgi:hypothetical protein
MTDERIRETLEAFEHFTGKYEREAVDAAIELREEITPHLIEVLRKVLSSPKQYLDIPDFYAHTYAFMLLGHFREARSHNVLVDLFSLPDDMPYALFGDLITEDLPMILYRTCGGSLDRMESLAMNRNADPYCRVAALDAMVFAVAEGMVQREDVVSFFGSLFSEDMAEPGSIFWDLWASVLLHIYPEELMDKVKIAYDKGLVSHGVVGYNHFSKALEEGSVETSLQRVREELQRRSLDDLHRRMSWWAGFEPDEEGESLRGSTAANASPKQSKKKKAAKKKKKIAKSSRQKNRP